MEEYWEDFVTEIYDNLESLYNEIEEFYNGHQDTSLEAIARVLHNIKGTSAALGHSLLSEATHHIESQFLNKVKSEKISQIPHCINIYEQILKLVVLGPDLDVEILRTLMREIAIDIDASGKVVKLEPKVTDSSSAQGQAQNQVKNQAQTQSKTPFNKQINTPQKYKSSKINSWAEALKDYKKPNKNLASKHVSDVNDFISRMKLVNGNLNDSVNSNSGFINATSPEIKVQMGKQTLIQLVYVSDLAEGVKLLELDNILRKAELKNNQNGISGCLLLYEKKVLQILEGDSEKVNRLYNKIAQDPAHTNVSLLSVKSIKYQSFNKWARLVIPKSYIGDQLHQIRSLGLIEEDIVFPRKNAALELLIENFSQFYK